MDKEMEKQIRDIARAEAQAVYNDLGTMYGVASVPAHSHNGVDSNPIPGENAGFFVLPATEGSFIQVAKDDGYSVSGAPTPYSNTPAKIITPLIPCITSSGDFFGGLAIPGTVIVADEIAGPTTLWVYVNGNWQGVTLTAGGGGSGSPGGADTNVQYNDSGSFGGSGDFKWNNTTKVLSFAATDATITGKSVTVEATAGEYVDVGGTAGVITVGADLEGDGGDLNWFPGGLNTTSTLGFIMLGFCAGVPTGVPTSGTGAVVYDTTHNKLYVYNGGWKSVTLT